MGNSKGRDIGGKASCQYPSMWRDASYWGPTTNRKSARNVQTKMPTNPINGNRTRLSRVCQTGTANATPMAPAANTEGNERTSATGVKITSPQSQDTREG